MIAKAGARAAVKAADATAIALTAVPKVNAVGAANAPIAASALNVANAPSARIATGRSATRSRAHAKPNVKQRLNPLSPHWHRMQSRLLAEMAMAMATVKAVVAAVVAVAEAAATVRKARIRLHRSLPLQALNQKALLRRPLFQARSPRQPAASVVTVTRARRLCRARAPAVVKN